LTALGVGFVDTAEDGLVGVDKVLRAEAAQQPFTLVFMDYTMPRCDGAEMRHV
jgi:CheY-like chemotaxis protein